MEEARTSNEPQQSIDKLQKEFERLCDEQDQLPTDGFAQVFEVLYSLEEAFTPQHPYTENEAAINKALEITGNSSNEAFCKAFKRNNQIIIEGREIQRKGLELIAQDFTGLIPQQEKQKRPDGWQFVSLNIVASQELHNGINEILKDEAEHGKGIFANVTDIPLEDIYEDEFDMVEVYNCQATFTKYFEELKKFGIIGLVGADSFLNQNFKYFLLGLLKKLATYIKEHTDKQAATKNEITNTLKILDELPHWGLFFQILTLQGLCRWLESVNINEGDKGFDEVQTLYDWLLKYLAEKIMNLAFKPYSDGDKARLKPLTDYLYSTEVERWLQEQIFCKPQQKSHTAVTKQDIVKPQQETELEKKYFAKAIQAGLMGKDCNSYIWLHNSGLKASLGYFINRVFNPKGTAKIPYKRMENLFNVSRLDTAIDQALTAKKPQKWRKEIDTLFDD